MNSNNPDELVREFHTKMGYPINDHPTADIPFGLTKLREWLISKEVNELTTAVKDQDIISIADALADIVYVCYGTALSYGIDLPATLAEVHRSNMTKDSGNDDYQDTAYAVAVKGDDYQPPNIAAVLGLDDEQ